MIKFAEFVLRFRIPVIIITLLLTAFFGYSLKDLKINSDILSYLPQDDPLVTLFNEVGDKFGGNSLAMVALETKNVFNPGTLQRVNEITEKFKLMPEISYVTSLTDVIDIKKNAGAVPVG